MNVALCIVKVSLNMKIYMSSIISIIEFSRIQITQECAYMHVFVINKELSIETKSGTWISWSWKEIDGILVFQLINMMT